MSKIVGTILAITALFILLVPLHTWGDEDISINVEEGSFAFKNLRLTQEEYHGGPILKGDIVNNTGKDWLNLEFEVDVYDTAGNKLKDLMGEPFRLLFFGIKSGATKSLGPGYGFHFIGVRAGAVQRYEIRFKSGEYRANYSFGMTKPKVSKDLLFEDAFVKISFIISKEQIGFVILNKTSNPIKIDWNQVSYIDVLNESHKVMHSGVKYVDKANVLPPTIIPPTAKIQDIVFPTDHIYYTSGKYGGWNKIPIFPEAPKARLFKGKTFSVFMPLEINGTVKNYLFTFIVEDVDA